MNKRRFLYLTTIFAAFALPISLVTYKLVVLDYPLAAVVPAVSYQVEVIMDVDGHQDDISLRTFLPRSDNRQTISDEGNNSGVFSLAIEQDPANRIATWTAQAVEGRHSVRYSYTAIADHVRYVIPAGLPIPKKYPAWLDEYLLPEKGLDMEDPLVIKEVVKVVPEAEPTLLESLTRIHRHLQDNFANRDFSGYTNAATALKLGEASCNGKGRLFVSMARKLNIPARLVGGVIMESTTKRTSHQWVVL